ncbi:MAG TPA: coenzyme F420-0:L-glutamate ligase [Candidatus Syntrophoarchaeum butanivorans]|uniref:Coenzyme F420:L-glutamate ligase n=1 Tax=Candidatus Syntropharchaeum butanivorans TaxID=1839936 RepID=A0A1F2P3Q4_9EURY|nr:MAG: F420-dependent oxidoreductase [Candidatus Syntrophoarchaeum butanivorans]HEC57678.1 coenzyme F420-0:L-glutamate ligase [Candidatus Syntrophoarchaeum butanivorans]
MRVEVFTVDDMPRINEGDDLTRLILERVRLEDNDILAIASSVVAKAEGRVRNLSEITPSAEAYRISRKLDEDPRFVEAVLEESCEILIESPFILVRRPDGHVCVNAGVDRSNIEEGKIILLPRDPSASAARIRSRIYESTGRRVSVIITDTNGRAFRVGQTGLAIGTSGISSTRDWVGLRDLFGNVLTITNEAIIDEIAGFANLMMGEGDGGTPAVVIRGLSLFEDVDAFHEIIRDEHEDMILRALRRVRFG